MGPQQLENQLKRYKEEHRKYHTLEHIEQCLRDVDDVRLLLEITSGKKYLSREKAPILELAFWFHDIVYNSQRHDNEEKSAKLLEQVLSPLLPKELFCKNA